MTTVDRTYGVAEGTAIKAPCRVATTGNITLSGLQSIDGVTVAAADRVLVKDQSNTVNNGIYAASSGNWLRTVDFDGAYDIVNGSLILVVEGTANRNQLFVVTSSNPVTVGTSAITFALNTSIGTAGDISTALSASPVFPVNNINTSGLDLLQLTGGTPAITSDYAYNRIIVANDATNAAGHPEYTSSALYVELDTGGPNINNEKIAGRFVAQYTVPGATNPHDLIAVAAGVNSSLNVGGTNTLGGAGSIGTLYALNPSAQLNSGATNFAVVSSGEYDVAINAGASAAHRWGLSIVGLGALQGATSDGAVQVSSNAVAPFKNVILLSNANGGPPVSTNGNIIGSDGSTVTAQSFANLIGYTFTSYIFKFANFEVTGDGNLTATTIGTTASIIETGATHTVATTESVIVANHAGTVTITLPSPASFPGRWLTLKTVTANTVVSASSNVVPLIGGAAGTAILAATAGKWAQLQSTGGAWEIMASN